MRSGNVGSVATTTHSADRFRSMKMVGAECVQAMSGRWALMGEEIVEHRMPVAPGRSKFNGAIGGQRDSIDRQTPGGETSRIIGSDTSIR